MLVKVEYLGPANLYRVAGESFRHGEVKTKDKIADSVFLQAIRYEKDIRVTEIAPKEDEVVKVDDDIEIEPLDTPKRKGRK